MRSKNFKRIFKMKDPAALLYIDKWLVSTKGMKGNAKGWYLNLILYQYDKGELPNDIEELANLCDVRFSEFKEFEQVFEQVLKHKFRTNENGCLVNDFANEIIQKRKQFIDKRSNSGKISYMVRFVKKHFSVNKACLNWLKENIDLNEINTKNEQVFKQVLEQKIELYINKDENKDKDKDKDEFEILEKYPFDDFWELYDKKVGSKKKCQKKWQKLNDEIKEKIMLHIPKYVESTPEKKFRKNPETYLNNESWNDEIIFKQDENTQYTSKPKRIPHDTDF